MENKMTIEDFTYFAMGYIFNNKNTKTLEEEFICTVCDFVQDNDLLENYYSLGQTLSAGGRQVFTIESIFADESGEVYVHISGEPFECDVRLRDMSLDNMFRVVMAICRMYKCKENLGV